MNITLGDTSPTSQSWGEFIAQDKGFFAKNGLKVSAVYAGSVNAVGQGVVGGSYQIGNTNIDTMIRAKDAGADIEGVGSPAIKFPFKLEVPKSITSVSELEGKTISLASPGGSSAYLLFQWLSHQNISSKKFTYVYSGNSPARYAALTSGAASAAVLTQPFDFKAEANGYHPLVDFALAEPNYGFEAFIVNKSWAAKNGSTIQKFLKAYAEALSWLQDYANEKDAVAILSKYTKQDTAISQETYNYYIKQIKAFPAGADLPTSAVQGVIDAMKFANYHAKGDASSYINRSYLPNQ